MENVQNQVFKREDLITVSQFAKRLPCSRSFAYDLVDRGPKDGGILAFRYGEKKGIVIPKTEVERFRKTRIVSDLNNGDGLPICAEGGM